MAKIDENHVELGINHENNVKMAKNPYILCKIGKKSSIIIDYRLRIQENHG
jgi:hypothetical protein